MQGIFSFSTSLEEKYTTHSNTYFRKFIEAVRGKSPTPLDIYDSVTMSAVVALSGASIAKGSAPIPFPDFTR